MSLGERLREIFLGVVTITKNLYVLQSDKVAGWPGGSECFLRKEVQKMAVNGQF